MDFIVFLLASYFVTRTVNVAKIGEPLRRYIDSFVKKIKFLAWVPQFIRCPLCLGFWVGLILQYLFFSFDWSGFISACCAGAGSYLLSRWEPLDD